MRVERWLEQRLGRPRAGETLLVLCRNRATVALVRRWMALRGGWIGADVVTPHGLLASIARDPLGGRDVAEGGLPSDNPIVDRVAGRPGLLAVLRRWVRRVRELRACDGLTRAPDWLVELSDSGWADGGDAARLTEALDQLAKQPMRPTESHAYDRVVLLGFESGLEILEPAALAVARCFSGTVEQPPQPDTRPVPCCIVPDAAAEVRLATLLASSGTGSTLCLVSEATTARRLRDALLRNGVPCGFTDPPAAGASSLGGIALRMVPWFGEPDPPMRVSDIAWVFGHRAMGTDLLPEAREALERDRVELGLSEPSVALGRRRLVRLLREARVLDAPLSRWLERLRVLRQDASRDESVRGAALSLEVRLRLLRARATGEDPARALQGPESLPLDDFDALVAELLGEEADSLLELPAAHTLGALRRYLADLRPRIHDDPAARAVLSQLRERDAVHADAATAREALATPVDPGQLVVGVDVLTYDDWDGRPTDRLLLLDVHHKGLARRPTPDPFLDEAEQRALGLPAGQALVDFRIAQVHRAAALADEVLAIVAERDAGGRDLVPPIQLELVPGEAPSTGSYGFDLALSERSRVEGLRVLVSAEAHEPEGPEPWRTLAIQASAEWYRSGRGPLAHEPAVERYPSLDVHLAAMRPVAPDWLLPWLGHAEAVPEAALPDRAWSTSRLFEPLATCLYRAYGSALLGLEPPEEIPEDLDPRELGTAIHGALEHLGAGLRLRVEPRDLDRARDEVVEALRANTRVRLERLADDLAGLSAARSAAVQGRISRWNAHWPSWARSRVQPRQGADHRQKMDFVRGHPYTLRAAESLAREVPASAAYDRRTRVDWVVNTADDFQSKLDPSQWSDGRLAREDQRYGSLRADFAGGLRAYLEHEHFRAVLNVLRSAAIRADGATAVVDATAVEVPFGRPEDPPGRLVGAHGEAALHLGDVSLSLGAGPPVQISGRIDRLVVSYFRGRPLFEVLDYKTGASHPESPWRLQQELLSGRRPQLMIYAMALQAAERAGQLGPELEGAMVAAVGWDHVQHTEEDPAEGDRRAAPNRIGRFLVDTPTLEAVAGRIGALVDDARAGRWTLSPRSDACPALQSWSAFCDLQGACRLRDLPPTREVS